VAKTARRDMPPRECATKMIGLSVYSMSTIPAAFFLCGRECPYAVSSLSSKLAAQTLRMSENIVLINSSQPSRYNRVITKCHNPRVWAVRGQQVERPESVRRSFRSPRSLGVALNAMDEDDTAFSSVGLA